MSRLRLAQGYIGCTAGFRGDLDEGLDDFLGERGSGGPAVSHVLGQYSNRNFRILDGSKRHEPGMVTKLFRDVFFRARAKSSRLRGAGLSSDGDERRLSSSAGSLGHDSREGFPNQF